MYIDNQIKRIRISWTKIATHTYMRVSRSKWQIKLNYACGAEMLLENQPDDLIQCLVLGAFNSRKPIEVDDRPVAAGAGSGEPLSEWRDVQGHILT